MIRFCFFIFLSLSLYSQDKELIFSAMSDEMDRSLEKLKIADLQKPYYIHYKINHSQNYVIEASLGGIIRNDESESSILSVDVRVGDYNFDNSNFFDIGFGFFGSSDDEENFKRRRIPLKPDYESLRRELWLATDAAYKQSSELYSKKIAALKNKNRKDTIPDFMEMTKLEHTNTISFPKFDRKKFEDIVKEVSKVFGDYPEIQASAVLIEFVRDKFYYLNSEKVKFDNNNFYTGFEIVASTQSADGMPLANYYTAYSRDPNKLPNIDSLITAAKHVAETLTASFKSTELDDDYSGPVMFTGRAAAEVFAQNFAGNLVAQRNPVSESGFSAGGDQNMAFQTKIGGRVLPEFLSVELLPANSDYNNTELIGALELDENGAKALNTTLVKDGYLETLISERIPTKRIKANLGHKRGGAAMYSVLKLNSNDREMSYDEMKKRMIELCKKRELPYGVIIKNIINRNIFSTTLYGQNPGLFNFPRGDGNFIISEMYKVYPDGREEITRGANGKGFTVRSFKDIINVGKDTYAYNLLASSVISSFVSGGSQYIPSSILSKNLLFEDGELNIPTEDFNKIPVLSNPITKN